MNNIAPVKNEIQKPILINDLLKFEFFKDAQVSPKSEATYNRALNQFFKWLESECISRPKHDDILRYRDTLLINHKPATVQAYIGAVRLFFGFMDRRGLYPNIAEHTKTPSTTRDHKKEALTAAQVKKVLKGIDKTTSKGLRNYAIMVLLFTGGLRTIEISRAKIEGLRTSGGYSVLYIQGKGKTESTDFIKLVPQCDDAIRDYLKTRPAAAPSDPLFCSTSNNSTGKPLSTRSISKLAKHALTNAGFIGDQYTAHSTRHTAVTLALKSGGSLEEVQQFARHANISTTLIYAHNLDKLNNTCGSMIAKAIF